MLAWISAGILCSSVPGVLQGQVCTAPERNGPIPAPWDAASHQGTDAAAKALLLEGSYAGAVHRVVDLFSAAEGDFVTAQQHAAVYVPFMHRVHEIMAVFDTLQAPSANAAGFVTRRVRRDDIENDAQDRTLELLVSYGEEPELTPEITIDRAALDLIPFWAICRTASSLRSLGAPLSAPERLASTQRARERLARWRNWAGKGLTPTPLELLVNQLVSIVPRRGDLEPPRSQLVLLRPSPGVELSTGLGDPKTVFLVELGGVIFYNGSRDFFFGASAALSVGDNGGPGFLVHLGEYLTAGLVWRDVVDDDIDDRDMRIIASADLLSILGGAGADIGKLLPGALR